MLFRLTRATGIEPLDGYLAVQGVVDVYVAPQGTASGAVKPPAGGRLYMGKVRKRALVKILNNANLTSLNVLKMVPLIL